jgi:ribosomal protein L28
VTTNYVGTNALNLPGTTPQYIQIPSVNLAQNFTLQVWLYPISLAGDFGIFGQCDSNSKCLSLSLRNGRFTLSFDSMNITNNTLTSSSFIYANVWTHLTVAYDAVLLQQQIYVNGQIDAINSGIVTPYAGILTGSITTIGRSVSSAYGLSYFQGYEKKTKIFFFLNIQIIKYISLSDDTSFKIIK